MIVPASRARLLVLSRQPLPTLDRYPLRRRLRPGPSGAYVLADAPGGKTLKVILIGTGSEVALCVAAHEALTNEGIAARVVSMPCWELFEQQDQAYRDQVLPDMRARVAVEEALYVRLVPVYGPGRGGPGHGNLRRLSPDREDPGQVGFEPAHVIQAARDQVARWHHTGQ